MRHIARLFAVLLLAGCQVEVEEPKPMEVQEPPSELPFQQVALDDLTAFKSVASNWSIAGGVLSDHTQDKAVATEAGTGILVNQDDETNRDNLFTDWEHADLELTVDVMMPKGSNSGIYFQGRYEIQLLDSWGKENPSFSDLGGIYQRWDQDKPEGERGYEGHAPRLNAAKAPGLWQSFHIIFRAPRFNAAGEKIENARFEKVTLNGVTLHENVEVTGPTRAAAFGDEAAMGSINDPGRSWASSTAKYSLQAIFR